MENHNVFAGALLLIASANVARIRPGSQRLCAASKVAFVPVWGDQCLIGGDPLQAILLSRDQVTLHGR